MDNSLFSKDTTRLMQTRSMLQSFNSWWSTKKTLKGFEVTGNHDTPNIIEARDKAAELDLKPWKDRLWVTILSNTHELISIIQQAVE
jgi:hypothetical protein